ncbi:1-acyl-sn-glycerol-3-phosphate acyltransferase [Oryzihumus leptocrescens]|uniref:Acyltransferase-like protein n=1 Tax=Oryzihumus leptocrescens TaxID=297536 RepID=A0A542ZM40_9MICO|nr:1-acyl-sn-glycerol-3-phosphate acyltransferase [Oryzihumus leptocrescens]TQL61401.1 acyltransferase-like protein [Oryzihumus leptocrescens]
MPPRWLRRALLPLTTLLVVAVLALLLLVAGVAAVLRPLTPRHRVLRAARFGAAYLVVDLRILFSCLRLWLQAPVAARRDAAGWADAHWALLESALRDALRAGERHFGFRVVVDEPARRDVATVPVDEPLLVLARHAGPGDSFAIAHLLMTEYHRRPRIVLKDKLQLDPALDVLLNRLSCCFIPSRSGAGEDLPARLGRLAADLAGPEALLIFPEGGNWTPRRRRRAIRRLRRRGHVAEAARARRMEHVMPPRPAGVLACLDARPDMDVIVAAHAGLDRLVSPSQVWRALPLVVPMRLRWWHVPSTAVPRDEDARTRWLIDEWAKVDAWVEARPDGSVVDPSTGAGLPTTGSAGPGDVAGELV